MKVLVLGGTGAMGRHLCAALSEAGMEVVCTSRSNHGVSSGAIRYVKGNAKESAFLDRLLRGRWDAVVDFMVWSTAEFRARYKAFLDATDQYVYLSSYRVYADSKVLREDSPRLLDTVDDDEYLATDEYALSKARCEDLLRNSGRKNWTIVRPAITYDGACGRLQLGVYEASDWLWRAIHGVPVPMPKDMLERDATMSYGGDVAKMIARLIGKDGAYGTEFTVSGSDHMTWEEVAAAYQSAVPFEVRACGIEEFERMRGGVYQIRYDRLFNRIVDNSKVLSVAEIDASSITSMRLGLAREARVLLSSSWVPDLHIGLQARLDRLCGGCPSFSTIAHRGGVVPMAKYSIRRFVS